jgi:hypothetical protein
VGTHDILDRVAFAFEFSKFFLNSIHNFDLLKISLGEDKVTLVKEKNDGKVKKNAPCFADL